MTQRLGERSQLRLERFVAVDCYSLHAAIGGAIVRDHSMLRAAVIPHRDRVRTPSEAATEIRRLDMPVEKAQQRHTLARFHSFDRRGEGRVDEQALAPALRMGANTGCSAEITLGCLRTAEVIGLIARAREGAWRYRESRPGPTASAASCPIAPRRPRTCSPTSCRRRTQARRRISAPSQAAARP